jgi:cytoskeletal protein CcmA (bactofilin family)
MQSGAHIGETIVIKGEMTAGEDVVIAGRVEGSIHVEGHALTVAPGANVVADVRAAEVIVAGHVFGSVTADRRIDVRATADVEGELGAPAIAVADGATVSGRVETTGARGPGLQLAC